MDRGKRLLNGGLPGNASVQQIADVDRHSRHFLAGIVMQLAHDAAAFSFLSCDEPAGEIADPLVAGAKVSFLANENLLGATTSTTLYEEARNQARLHREDEQPGDDIPAVQLEERWLIKQDETLGGDAPQ